MLCKAGKLIFHNSEEYAVFVMDTAEKPEQKAPEPKKESRSLLSRGLNLAAYPISAAVGYFTFNSDVHHEFYSNFAKRKMFADMQAPLSGKIDSIITSGMQDPHVDVPTEIRNMQDGYREAVNARIRNWGYKGMDDYWKALHDNQKLKIFAETTSVTGITFGALILLSNNIDKLKDVFNFKDDKDQAAGR